MTFVENEHEEDELFDLFILNEINGNNNKGGKTSGSGGGCLTCLLLLVAVPVGIVIGIALILT